MVDLTKVFTDGNWIEAKDQSKNGIRLVQTGNIGVGNYLDKPKNKKFITEDTFNKLRCTEVLPGDLLISRLPDPIGRCCIAPQGIGKMVTAVDCTIVRFIENISRDYIKQYLCTDKYFNDVFKFNAGSTRQRVSRGNLGTIQVPIPAFSEQEKIADFLSTYDRMINVQSQRVEAMKTRKKGLLQKIFSQEIRFKDDQGQDYQEWEKTTVENLASNIIGGGTPSTKNASFYTGNIPWVSSSDLLENKINYLNVTRFITQNAIDNSATKLIPANSVMIVSRVGVGKVAINTLPLCTSQDFMNLVVKEGNSPIFIAYLLMNLMLRKKNSVQGTAIKGIPSAEIKKFNVLVPSIIEQQKIADFLTAVDAQIEVEEKRLETMKTIKKGLLQQMFI